jgi:uncharacterized protein (TIGR02996 family)
MSVESPFWESMRDEPDSVEPGFVYADWLEEQGDSRADLIRAQMALRGPIDAADCPVLRARERLLTKELRSEILGPVRSLTKRVDFFGGLIIPEMTSDVFRKNAEAILHESPTLGIRFTKLNDRRLANCRELQSLRAVNLQGNSTKTARVALIGSKHLTGLRAINASDVVARPEFAEAWCTDKWPHLTRAVLESGSKINLAEMLHAPAMKRLRHLSLGYLDRANAEDFIQAFSDARTAPQLETFDPAQMFLDDRIWRRFCESVSLPSLRRLDISETFSSPEDLQTLLTNQGLSNLQELAALITTRALQPETFQGRISKSLVRLSLRQCRFTEQSSVAFAESPLFRQLESLRIAPGNFGRHLNAIFKAGVVAKRMRVLQLANSGPNARDILKLQDIFPNLETLAIDCSATAAKALAELSLPKLRRLELGDFKLTPAIVKALFRAPWFDQLETLNLRDLIVTDEAIAELAKLVEGRSMKLRVLDLGQIETAAARSMADSDAFSNLEFLGFSMDPVGKPTLRRVKMKYGPTYDGQWPVVSQSLGGWVPEFFVRHPFGGIV